MLVLGGPQTCLAVYSPVCRLCPRVLLQPTVPKLLALQEFLLVFLDTQTLRLPSILPLLLPLLSRILALACDQKDRGGPTAWLHRQGDWRIVFKSLQVFEDILVHVHPSVLDSLLAKAARTARSSVGPQEGASSAGKLGASAFLRECCFSHSEVPGPSATERGPHCKSSSVSEEVQRTVGGCRWSDLEASEAGAGVSELNERGKENGEGAEGRGPSIVLVGAALARLWLEAASGLRHEHPWVRAVSLRCIGRYIARKPTSAYSRGVPCLFYLSKQEFLSERPGATSGPTQRASEFEVRKGREATSEMQVRVSAEDETGIEKNGGSIPRENRASSPGADLMLGALAPLGGDTFLERNPGAVVSALALIVPLLRLSLSRPELVTVLPRYGLIRPKSKEQGGFGVGSNCTVAKDRPDTRKGKRKRVARHSGYVCALAEGVYNEDRRDRGIFGAEAHDEEESDNVGEDSRVDGVNFLETQEEIEALMQNDEERGRSDFAGSEPEDAKKKRRRVSRLPSGGERTEPGQGKTGRGGGARAVDAESKPGQNGDVDENLNEPAENDLQMRSGNEHLDSNRLDEDGLAVVPGSNQGSGDEDTGDDVSDKVDSPDVDLDPSDALALQVLLQSNSFQPETEACQRSGLEKNNLTQDVLAFEDRAAALASSLTPFTCHGEHTVQSRTVVSGNTKAYADAPRLRPAKGSDLSEAMACDESRDSGGREGEPSLTGCGGRGVGGAFFGASHNCEDASNHPVVFLARRFNFWLRRHLGTLGARRVAYSRRARYEAAGTHRPSAPAPVCTSITRVGAILLVLHHLVHLLPVNVPRPLEDDKGQPTLSCNEAVDCEQRHSGADCVLGKVLQTVLLFVLEAAYRCSTVLGLHRSGEYQESGRVLLELLQNQHIIGAAAEVGCVTDPSDQSRLWGELQELSPRDQQIEVALAGTFVLNELQRRMREGGHDAVYLRLLSEIRNKVLTRRSERKARQRQQAVLEPQRHADKRRRQQLRKSLSKRRRMAELIARKRGKVPRETDAGSSAL